MKQHGQKMEFSNKIKIHGLGHSLTSMAFGNMARAWPVMTARTRGCWRQAESLKSECDCGGALLWLCPGGLSFPSCPSLLTVYSSVQQEPFTILRVLLPNPALRL